jgi:hypothetical protein
MKILCLKAIQNRITAILKAGGKIKYFENEWQRKM